MVLHRNFTLPAIMLPPTIVGSTVSTAKPSDEERYFILWTHQKSPLQMQSRCSGEITTDVHSIRPSFLLRDALEFGTVTHEGQPLTLEYSAIFPEAVISLFNAYDEHAGRAGVVVLAGAAITLS